MKKRLWTAIALAFVTTKIANAQKYDLNLSTPERIGDKYSVTATAARLQQSESLQRGRVLRSQTVDYQVVLDGRAEVLAVDSKGGAFRISFTVGKFTKTEGGITTVVLKPGTLVLSDGSQPEEKQIQLKDGIMEAAVRDAFRTVQPPHIPNTDEHDYVFDTKEPKGVGDSWSINQAAAVANMKATMIIPIEGVAGTATVVSKGSFDGNECLNVVKDMKTDGVALVKNPAGFIPDEGTIQMTTHECIPTKPSAHFSKVSAETKTFFRMKAKAGTPNEAVTLETTISQKNSLVTTPLKP